MLSDYGGDHIWCRVLGTMLACSSPVKFVNALLLAVASLKSPKVRCKLAAYLDSSLRGEHGHRIASELVAWLLYERLHGKLLHMKISKLTCTLNICSTCDLAGEGVESGREPVARRAAGHQNACQAGHHAAEGPDGAAWAATCV